MEFEQMKAFLMRSSWFMLIILLPVTSFPWVVKFVGSDVVGLPSGLILGFLVLTWYIPAVNKNIDLPAQSLPLLGFLVAAIFSSALAFFLNIPPYKNNSPRWESLTSFVTLLIGVFMFLVTVAYTEKSGRLQWTFRLLNYSGAFILLWSILQAVAWRLYSGYPQWMELFHRFFSTGVLYKDRVTGLALEPSWYAHQLNLLYLPLWFSSTVTAFTAHRRRFLGITFENVLLVLGVLNLFLSLSRVGYLSFLLMVAVFFVQMNGKIVNQIFNGLSKKMEFFKNEKTGSLRKRKRIRFWMRFGLTVTLILLYLGLLAGSALLLSKFDDRMATLFQINFAQNDWLYRYLGKLDLGPRVSFWLAGWDVFRLHPIFGVGLGNSGFFFMDSLPEYAWSFPEIRSLMLHGSTVLNPKNLWARLLAETGLLGFTLFISWLLVIWKSAKELQKKTSPILRQVGLMGFFVIAALLIEGFSVDSFALPYYWISFGLVISTFRQAQDTSERLQSSEIRERKKV